MLLDGPMGYEEYYWSNGDTSQFTILHKEGVYFLIAVDSLGCGDYF
jgi:hypothetical protein